MRRARWFWLAALLVAALLAVVGCPEATRTRKAGGTGTGEEPAELQPVTVQLKWR